MLHLSLSLNDYPNPNLSKVCLFGVYKKDIPVMLGPDPLLMIKALALSLCDHVVLVQRHALELLVAHIPLSSV